MSVVFFCLSLCLAYQYLGENPLFSYLPFWALFKIFFIVVMYKVSLEMDDPFGNDKMDFQTISLLYRHLWVCNIKISEKN